MCNLKLFVLTWPCVDRTLKSPPLTSFYCCCFFNCRGGETAVHSAVLYPPIWSVKEAGHSTSSTMGSTSSSVNPTTKLTWLSPPMTATTCFNLSMSTRTALHQVCLNPTAILLPLVSRVWPAATTAGPPPARPAQGPEIRVAATVEEDFPLLSDRFLDSSSSPHNLATTTTVKGWCLQVVAVVPQAILVLVSWTTSSPTTPPCMLATQAWPGLAKPSHMAQDADPSPPSWQLRSCTIVWICRPHLPRMPVPWTIITWSRKLAIFSSLALIRVPLATTSGHLPTLRQEASPTRCLQPPVSIPMQEVVQWVRMESSSCPTWLRFRLRWLSARGLPWSKLPIAKSFLRSWSCTPILPTLTLTPTGLYVTPWPSSHPSCTPFLTPYPRASPQVPPSSTPTVPCLLRRLTTTCLLSTLLAVWLLPCCHRRCCTRSAPTSCWDCIPSLLGSDPSGEKS